MKNDNLAYKSKSENIMKSLLNKFTNWVLKDDNPIKDYNRNYCKFSKGYKSHR